MLILYQELAPNLITATTPSAPAGFARSRSRSRSSSSASLVPPRGADVRGAHLTPPGGRSVGRVENVPAAASGADDDQGALPPPVPTRRVRAPAGAGRRHVLGRARRVLRHRRPQRQRQEHATEDPRRHLPRRQRHRPRRRPALAVHRARRRLQHGAELRATTCGSTARCSASHARARERFDEIIGFAELERFVDQKLKNYSSGMLLRLAYSIAIQVEFDILLLDEVLAVGDEASRRSASARSIASARRARRSSSSATTSAR